MQDKESAPLRNFFLVAILSVWINDFLHWPTAGFKLLLRTATLLQNLFTIYHQPADSTWKTPSSNMKKKLFIKLHNKYLLNCLLTKFRQPAPQLFPSLGPSYFFSFSIKYLLFIHIYIKNQQTLNSSIRKYSTLLFWKSYMLWFLQQNYL